MVTGYSLGATTYGCIDGIVKSQRCQGRWYRQKHVESGEPPTIPNLSTGDNTTVWFPIPTRFISTIIPVGVTVEMPSLRGEKQNSLLTQKRIRECRGIKKEKNKILLQDGVTRYSLEVTVLIMVATQPVF